MTSLSGKTYWLIGASEGLGRELAKQLDAQGAQLVVSARKPERLETLRSALSQARIVVMDVTDRKSVQQAIECIGEIDGVIYNAGTYEPMQASEWDSEKALTMLDVNFIGAMRVLGAIVPRFVAKGQGDVTLIGSLAGYRGLPASIGYSASKAALRSLAETMRFDLRGTGVDVRLVNPGFIKTRLTQKNDFHMPMLMTPEKAARRVIKAMERRRFRTDFPAPFSWAIRVFGILPDWIVYRR